MIRRRPRGETTFSKATYDDKGPEFDPPSPARLEAEAELTAAECARERAKAKNITAAGGFVPWLLARLGQPPKAKMPVITRRL